MHAKRRHACTETLVKTQLTMRVKTSTKLWHMYKYITDILQNCPISSFFGRGGRGYFPRKLPSTIFSNQWAPRRRERMTDFWPFGIRTTISLLSSFLQIRNILNFQLATVTFLRWTLECYKQNFVFLVLNTPRRFYFGKHFSK